MGRFDGDAARFFGWSEETRARVAAQKLANRPTGKKCPPIVKEVDWRTTDWRKDSWSYEGNEDLLTERNGGTPVEGVKK
jgi:hypothetical protein